MTNPLDALQAETERTGMFLAGLTAQDWMRPTRCPPMNVRELAVHALRGAYRIVSFLQTPVSGEPQKDAVSYYRYDPVAVGVEVVDRAKVESEKRGPDADIAAEWREAWREALRAARAASGDDPVVASPLGTLRLHEYLRTRCVEVTIHSMDLRDAVGFDPDPTPEGLAATCDVLRGLLGGDVRPPGLDEVRFALTGTGREKLTDDERDLLGSRADRFPLLQ